MYDGYLVEVEEEREIEQSKTMPFVFLSECWHPFLKSLNEYTNDYLTKTLTMLNAHISTVRSNNWETGYLAKIKHSENNSRDYKHSSFHIRIEFLMSKNQTDSILLHGQYYICTRPY